MTSREALQLKKLPKSLTVIGGGYISAELSHFYGSLGTKVTILERGRRLVSREDNDISQTFTDIYSQKHKIFLNTNAKSVKKISKGIQVQAENVETGKQMSVTSEQLLVVVGRRPNSDLLGLKEAGYELTEKGYLKNNDYLETNVKGVYTLGDIAGNWPFKHSANLEAEVVVRNLFGSKKVKADYTGMPHAIFSSPQIAGVGMTEQELEEKKIEYKKASYKYQNTGMGMALLDETSFVNAYSDQEGKKILGCHIIGPEASTLIHEVAPVMRRGGTPSELVDTIHVHPALSEVIERTFAQLR
jgi:dihydrolipoamide dehydrogenase